MAFDRITPEQKELHSNIELRLLYALGEIDENQNRMTDKSRREAMDRIRSQCDGSFGGKTENADYIPMVIKCIQVEIKHMLTYGKFGLKGPEGSRFIKELKSFLDSDLVKPYVVELASKEKETQAQESKKEAAQYKHPGFFKAYNLTRQETRWITFLENYIQHEATPGTRAYIEAEKILAVLNSGAYLNEKSASKRFNLVVDRTCDIGFGQQLRRSHVLPPSSSSEWFITCVETTDSHLKTTETLSSACYGLLVS